MPAPLDDVCLFSDGCPAMMMPVCVVPYLPDECLSALMPACLMTPGCLEMPTPLDDVCLSA